MQGFIDEYSLSFQSPFLKRFDTFRQRVLREEYFYPLLHYILVFRLLISLTKNSVLATFLYQRKRQIAPTFFEGRGLGYYLVS
ncbi:hypothetical protein GCM10008982_11000 [Anoxybacillus voinovskiensis]|nr:hypothetical protein GCM10008982_11000 [Anoxybacillus voinovskiensis]